MCLCPKYQPFSTLECVIRVSKHIHILISDWNDKGSGPNHDSISSDWLEIITIHVKVHKGSSILHIIDFVIQWTSDKIDIII